MKCPACHYEWKLPGPQAGGRAKVKKGFAMGQPSVEARKQAWRTRKAREKRIHNSPICGNNAGLDRTSEANNNQK
jgi:hypothetical protein